MCETEIIFYAYLNVNLILISSGMSSADHFWDFFFPAFNKYLGGSANQTLIKRNNSTLIL